VRVEVVGSSLGDLIVSRLYAKNGATSKLVGGGGGCEQ
jgi:hypothetical protein